MELNKICEKIINDAKVQAAGIIEDANRKSQTVISEASEKHREKAEKIKANAPLIAKETYDKMISDATLLAKKEILAGKRRLLNSVFEEALIKLRNLSSEEYKALLSVKGKAITENAEVETEKRYEKDITDEFLKSVNPLLSKSKTNAESGFNFVMESSRLNCDFSETVSRILEEKDSELASILFS